MSLNLSLNLFSHDDDAEYLPTTFESISPKHIFDTLTYFIHEDDPIEIAYRIIRRRKLIHPLTKKPLTRFQIYEFIYVFQGYIKYLKRCWTQILKLRQRIERARQIKKEKQILKKFQEKFDLAHDSPDIFSI
jgi:hypothetical protein